MSQSPLVARAAKIPAMRARDDVPLAAPSRSYARMAMRRFRANPLAMAGFIILTAMVLMALGADLISEYVTGHTTYEQSPRNRFAPIGDATFPLGSDELGRDIATRIAHGARVSLGVAGLSVVVALLIGASCGMLAGYFTGWVDGVLMRFVDVMLAIPTLLFLLLVAALWRMGPWTLAIVIAAISWTTLARLVRGEVLAVSAREYVDAARLMGAPNHRIMVRHILPNILPVIIVWGSLTVPSLILAEAALSFLGLGIQPPRPSWGNMLSNAQQTWSYSWGLVLLPGLAIYLTVFAINLVGNGLRDALDPRLVD